MNSYRELQRLYDFDEYSRREIGFYHCQSGFDAGALKEVIVWTLDDAERAAAWLVGPGDDAAAVRREVALRRAGVNPWGRFEWIADFSDVDEPGDYRLNVEFGDRSAASAPFAIAPDAYATLAHKAAKHYFLKRCGVFCHTRDADIRRLDADGFGELVGHRDVTGGWHDAHDDNKWTVFAWMALEGLLSVHETLAPEWPGANEPLPYCLAEAWWEIEWLLKMQKDDGSFYFSVWEWGPVETEDGRPRLNVWDGQRQMYDDLGDDGRILCDEWGEGRVADLLGITKGCSIPSTPPKYVIYLAQAIRHFARLVRPHDGELAGRCRDAARRAVDHVLALDSLPPFQWLEVKAGLAMFYLEEHKDDGDDEALRRAETEIEAILVLQQPEGHFHASETCRGLEAYPEEAGDERALVDYPFAYALPLIDYCKLDAAGEDGGLRWRAREALARFADMLGRFCGACSFGQMTELRFDRAPAMFYPLSVTGHGYSPYILSAGVVLAEVGRLTGERRLIELAQRQLYWTLGANPRFMCFMNDEGVRNTGQCAVGAHDTINPPAIGYYRHVRDMRWGVTTGMFGPMKRGEFAGVTSPEGDLRAEDDQAPNMPNTGGTDGRYNCRSHETWLNATGWFLRLLSAL